MVPLCFVHFSLCLLNCFTRIFLSLDYLMKLNWSSLISINDRCLSASNYYWIITTDVGMLDNNCVFYKTVTNNILTCENKIKKKKKQGL